MESQIKVSMFDDRIEIISPGGLPSGITEDEYLSAMAAYSDISTFYDLMDFSVNAKSCVNRNSCVPVPTQQLIFCPVCHVL